MISTTSLTLLFAIGAAFAAPAAGSKFRDAKNIHIVPNGGKVIATETDFYLLDANGATLLVEPKVTLAVQPAGNARDIPTIRQTSQNGTALASWINNDTSNPIELFISTVTVPSLPDNDDGQILSHIFSFGSEDYDLATTLLYGVEPGVGGGPYWTIFSSFFGSGNAFVSLPVNVSVGQSLRPEIVVDDTPYTAYIARFLGIDESSITVETNSVLNQVGIEFEGVLLQNPVGDLPSGQTLVNQISLIGAPFTLPMNWTIVEDNTFGLTADVVVDGPSNAEISFTYT